MVCHTEAVVRLKISRFSGRPEPRSAQDLKTRSTANFRVFQLHNNNDVTVQHPHPTWRVGKMDGGTFLIS
jgi:hypothetical protein